VCCCGELDRDVRSPHAQAFTVLNQVHSRLLLPLLQYSAALQYYISRRNTSSALVAVTVSYMYLKLHKLHNPTLLNALNPIGHPLTLMSFIALQRLCSSFPATALDRGAVTVHGTQLGTMEV
jgi:hypothetical protein